MLNRRMRLQQAQLRSDRWTLETRTVHRAAETTTNSSTSTNAVSGRQSLHTLLALEDDVADGYHLRIDYSMPEMTGLAQPITFHTELSLEDGTQVALDSRISCEDVDAALMISGRSVQRGNIQMAVLSSVAGCALATPVVPLAWDVTYAPTACTSGMMLADALYGVVFTQVEEDLEHDIDVHFVVSVSTRMAVLRVASAFAERAHVEETREGPSKRVRLWGWLRFVV